MKLIRRPIFLPLIMLVTGAVGFVASFLLTLEKLKVLNDPNYSPACDVNPIISCGSVMNTQQGEVFGFANSLIGIAAFAAIIMIGLAILAGGRFKRWFWLILQSGLMLGLIFAHWLIYQSLYSLGTLCPYCMVVWLMIIPLFFYVTLFNFDSGNIPKISKSNKILRFVYNHHLDFLLVWYLIIIILILNRFWYYWSTLL